MILNYDDMIKISFFSDRVNQGLKVGLSYQVSTLETFDEFVQLYINLYNRAKLLHTQNSRSAPSNPAPAPHPLSLITFGIVTGIAPGSIDLSQDDRTPRK